MINQTYTNLEIIIVDDGSTDGSGEICDEYLLDSRVQVIHQENRGLSGARNAGLDVATGEYITFLDSDDAFHPDMIRTMIDTIVQFNTDLVACSFFVCETDECLANVKQLDRTGFTEEKKYTGREAIIGQIEGAFDEAAWNKLYKRSLWENLRFPEGRVYEDMQVMPYLYAKCGTIAVTPRELVYHRIRAGSITRTRTVPNMQDLLTAYGVIRDYVYQAQPPFPSESVRIMNENMVSILIIRWAEFRKQNDSTNEINELKERIIQFTGQEAYFIQTKAKAMWWMFRNCPSMLLPTRACYKRVKSVLSKKNRITE